MTNDQTVTQALEPCPFCGSRGEALFHPLEETWSAICTGAPECQAQMLYVGLTEAEAITAWNTRTAHSAVATCKFNICDGSGTFYDKVDGECRCTCHSGEGRSNGAEEIAQRLQDHMEQYHGVCLKASEWDAAIGALALKAHLRVLAQPEAGGER